MLIEFKTRNFQCFRDEVTLSLQPAGRDSKLRGNIWQGHRYRAIKSAAIFGPNASGKTSLLHALFVLAQFVQKSATKMNVDDIIDGIAPFRLAEATCHEPSAFEVQLELGGVGYRYRVEATRDRVWRELLERQDRIKGASWLALIDRDVARKHVSLHERLGPQSRRDQIVSDTRANALILSRAAERNVEDVLPLFQWFCQSVWHIAGGPGTPPDVEPLEWIASVAAGDSSMLRELGNFLRDADTGIVSVDTEPAPTGIAALASGASDHLSPEQKSALREVEEALRRLSALAPNRPSPEEEGARMRFFTEHRTCDGRRVRFALTDESHGTLRYLRLASLLLKRCQTGDLLVVDELHTGLHPQLARRLIQVVHSPHFGGAGTQMLFTTHDTSLLDPRLLRRDQVVLTQKNADGAAEVYSLWDFEEMPRNSAAWARNYLAGRFGAVPVFGPSLADIPKSDEPSPVGFRAGATEEAE